MAMKGIRCILKCRAGLNSLLIDWLSATKEEQNLQAEIATLLQLCGAYSITGAKSLKEPLGQSFVMMPCQVP